MFFFSQISQYSHLSLSQKITPSFSFNYSVFVCNLGFLILIFGFSYLLQLDPQNRILWLRVLWRTLYCLRDWSLTSKKFFSGKKSWWRRRPIQGTNSTEPSSSSSSSTSAVDVDDGSKLVLLVTNGDGIDSPGLTSLIEAIVSQDLYNVHVCGSQ